jgi:hypothetical protein
MGVHSLHEANYQTDDFLGDWINGCYGHDHIVSRLLDTFKYLCDT